MAYDTYEAARLISWSNKQAGIGPLSEAKLVEWINAGVGGLDWAFTYRDNREEIWYIDFLSLISLRLICLLHFESPDSKGTSLKEITAAVSKLRKSWAQNGPSPARCFGICMTSIRLMVPITLKRANSRILKKSGNTYTRSCGTSGAARLLMRV